MFLTSKHRVIFLPRTLPDKFLWHFLYSCIVFLSNLACTHLLLLPSLDKARSLVFPTESPTQQDPIKTQYKPKLVCSSNS